MTAYLVKTHSFDYNDRPYRPGKFDRNYTKHYVQIIIIIKLVYAV